MRGSGAAAEGAGAEVGAAALFASRKLVPVELVTRRSFPFEWCVLECPDLSLPVTVSDFASSGAVSRCAAFVRAMTETSIEREETQRNLSILLYYRALTIPRGLYRTFRVQRSVVEERKRVAVVAFFPSHNAVHRNPWPRV